MHSQMVPFRLEFHFCFDIINAGYVLRHPVLAKLFGLPAKQLTLLLLPGFQAN